MDNLINIQNYIACFKSIDYLSLAEKYFTNNEDIIIWKINTKCNFNCNYCEGSYEGREIDLDLITIKNSFNRNYKKWLIIITGGEPFLKRNFIDIVEVLTENHYIHINTNLSTLNIEAFVNRINPENVWGLNVAAHVLEREKYDKNFKTFIKNINLLQDKKFALFLSYVFYPELMNRIKNDFQVFRDGGVRNIILRPFIGTYNDLKYPDSYTPEELDFLNNFGNQEYELGEAPGKISFQNCLCLAGKRTFLIDELGFARRCEPLYKAGDKGTFGNFFGDSFLPQRKERICRLVQTSCPFQCIFYAKKSQNPFSTFFNTLIKVKKN